MTVFAMFVNDVMVINNNLVKKRTSFPIFTQSECSLIVWTRSKTIENSIKFVFLLLCNVFDHIKSFALIGYYGTFPVPNAWCTEGPAFTIRCCWDFYGYFHGSKNWLAGVHWDYQEPRKPVPESSLGYLLTSYRPESTALARNLVRFC